MSTNIPRTTRVQYIFCWLYHFNANQRKSLEAVPMCVGGCAAKEGSNLLLKHEIQKCRGEALLVVETGNVAGPEEKSVLEQFYSGI